MFIDRAQFKPAYFFLQVIRNNETHTCNNTTTLTMIGSSVYWHIIHTHRSASHKISNEFVYNSLGMNGQNSNSVTKNIIVVSQRGAIQVLRNGVGVGWVHFPEKSVMKGHGSTLLALRGVGGGQIPWKKALHNT